MEYQKLTKDYLALENEGKLEEACRALEEEIAYNLAYAYNCYSENKISVLEALDFMKFDSCKDENFEPYKKLHEEFACTMHAVSPNDGEDEYRMALESYVEIRDKLMNLMK